MSRRTSHTDRERAELEIRLLTKEESAANLAREAAISEPTLYRCREQFIEAGRAGLAVDKESSPQRRELDRVIARLAERNQVIGE